MEELQHFSETLVWLIPIILVLVIWETVWKIIAMWKSARNNHLVWFICIAVFNTLGILPIVYILVHRKRSVKEEVVI